MEYTRSEGSKFETFIGTPEEIAKLIRLIKKGDETNEGLKHLLQTRSLSPKINPNITINMPEPKGPSIEQLNKKAAEQVSKALKEMKEPRITYDKVIDDIISGKGLSKL